MIGAAAIASVTAVASVIASTDSALGAYGDLWGTLGCALTATAITTAATLTQLVRLVDHDGAAPKLRAVQIGNRRLCHLGVYELDECKATRAPRFAVSDDLDLRDLASSSAFKVFADLRFVRRVR